MATFRPYHSSPHSSVGHGESTEGTPYTGITAFSPEDARPSKPANAKTVGAPLKDGINDPFVSSSKSDSKLSATASSFQPFSIGAPVVAYGSGPIPGTAQYLDQVIKDFTTERTPQPTELTQFGLFTTGTGATRYVKVSAIYTGSVIEKVKTSLQNMGQRKGSTRLESVGKNAYIRFSNIVDATAAYRAIKQDHVDFSVEYISPSAFGQIASPHSSPGSYSAHEGQVFLVATYPESKDVNRKEFEDHLRALLAVEGTLCAWQKVAATEAGKFMMIAEFADSSMASRAISRLNDKAIGSPPVVVTVKLHTPDTTAAKRPTSVATPTRSSAEAPGLHESLNNMSLNDNQVFRFPGNALTPQGATSIASMGGYMTAANTPFGMPGGPVPMMVPGMYTPSTISPLGPYHGMTRQSPYSGNGYSGFGFNSLDYHGLNDYSPGTRGFNQGGFSHNGYAQDYGVIGPMSSTMTTPGYYGRYGPRRDNNFRLNSGLRRRHQSNPAAGHHNHVEIQRIQLGTDVRTTVMLRNIPNKIDQGMLKDIIDESSFGKYDFMYLRIDFSNNCNVGYAFINFTDPVDIVDFVVARANQKWSKFKSEKVAEVSYATIQGRDCLIQKFRNSSVMLEPPHYRPKLFFTIHDPKGRAGEEDEFPCSDNASKLKRSCENAEHVGLFAPNAGQHMRDEQRRRRSQYDRGTSLAEREDNGFDDSSMAYYGGNFSPRY